MSDEWDDYGESEEATAVVNITEYQRSKNEGRREHHLLVHVQGTEMGRVRELEGNSILIGRSTDAEIWLSDDGVSRKHARFVRQGNRFVLEDLHSANGTFVQGNRIERKILTNGDQIQLGPNAIFRYSITDDDQKALLEQLYSTSVTDPLTGARNREYLDTLLVSEMSYAKRHGHDLSFVLFDLDHFKAINDDYGHPAGDAVLAAVANTVRQALRAEDVLCRYGGEEFCVVLRSIDLAGAAAMGERIRNVLENLRVEHEGQVISLTGSVGCASRDELSDPSPTALISLADRRLYLAKTRGRNRVVASD